MQFCRELHNRRKTSNFTQCHFLGGENLRRGLKIISL